MPTSETLGSIERSDGIPLFVEEMTKAVLEAESRGAAERTAAAIPSPAFAVPATLHASLMARLDRLGVSQGGGADRSGDWSRVLPSSDSCGSSQGGAGTPPSALDRVIEAGLLFRQGVAPHATYLFKHALVQDAA